MASEERLNQFEDETVAVSLDTITNSKVIIDFMLKIVPSAEPEEWTASQFLVTDDKPTVAGLLLFSDEPQAALPKRSAIKPTIHGRAILQK